MISIDDEFTIDEADELLMHTYETLPENCKKYWKRRYEIFSKFDEGVYMTSELWFSVTPEDIAVFTAKLARNFLRENANILDVCCGGGGNSIQFAKQFKSVGAIDINGNNLLCTKRNAEIYGVADKIWTYKGDWKEMAPISGDLNTDWIPKEVLNSCQMAGSNGKVFDCVFSSPPWGGPSYINCDTFDVNEMKPFSVSFLARQFIRYSDNYIMFLPKNSDLDQLRQITKEINGESAKCRILYLEQWGRRVALLALWGEQLTTGEVDYNAIFSEESLKVIVP